VFGSYEPFRPLRGFGLRLSLRSSGGRLPRYELLRGRGFVLAADPEQRDALLQLVCMAR
jgi:hypothetical protein